MNNLLLVAAGVFLVSACTALPARNTLASLDLTAVNINYAGALLRD
ncbi:hypothetical protein [Paraglaciecola polaris]|uniref:Uncharacterized protein n=1 Tax=Paraglaciecola polaris LMG 21857 TaxID=1129793 RepID=K6YIR7_9ALTE|nr:hypothetical protein [Paraglaciecola polaris]GAC32629.1 hypothetical protein GPLA_1719 [Paraglaciecola polaris LMG 21857]